MSYFRFHSRERRAIEFFIEKSTFNKVRERYMENPFKYLQYKEYSITDVVKETGLTKYQLRKFKQQLE